MSKSSFALHLRRRITTSSSALPLLSAHPKSSEGSYACSEFSIGGTGLGYADITKTANALVILGCASMAGLCHKAHHKFFLKPRLSLVPTDAASRHCWVR